MLCMECPPLGGMYALLSVYCVLYMLYFKFEVEGGPFFFPKKNGEKWIYKCFRVTPILRAYYISIQVPNHLIKQGSKYMEPRR